MSDVEQLVERLRVTVCDENTIDVDAHLLAIATELIRKRDAATASTDDGLRLG